jgi:alcohol dehydrogenase
MEKLWDSNISPTTLLVDTVTTPTPQKVVRSGKLQPSKLVTHRFPMNDTTEGCYKFGNTAKEGALKAVLTKWRASLIPPEGCPAQVTVKFRIPEINK